MEMTTHSLNWFEIPVSDFGRAKVFYSAIFDFEMPEMPMGPRMMGFFLHDRTAGVGGAIVAGEGCVPTATGTLVYLAAGRDLSTVLLRVEPAGGAILVPKTPIGPEMGFFAIFRDSEGNTVGLHSMT
jgi:predicted enzyme related to lactoylglutathione lyase